MQVWMKSIKNEGVIGQTSECKASEVHTSSCKPTKKCNENESRKKRRAQNVFDVVYKACMKMILMNFRSMVLDTMIEGIICLLYGHRAKRMV